MNMRLFFFLRHIFEHLKRSNILVEDQNGLRTGMSCIIDHICVMCSVLRNRKMNGKDTFSCFIDYEKAFKTYLCLN